MVSVERHLVFSIYSIKGDAYKYSLLLKMCALWYIMD